LSEKYFAKDEGLTIIDKAKKFGFVPSISKD
jgi:hypothetical protein